MHQPILQILKELSSKGLIIEHIEEQCIEDSKRPCFHGKTIRKTSRWSIRREESRGGRLREIGIGVLGSFMANVLWHIFK